MNSRLLVSIIVVIVVTIEVVTPAPRDASSAAHRDYMRSRDALLNNDATRRTGARTILNSKEQELDTIILREKRAMIEATRMNRSSYHPSLSFFYSKELAESSSIFKLIKQMPKGAALHLHDLAIASLDWVVKNVTYRDNVYMCVNSQNFVQLAVFLTPPDNPDCPWQCVEAERARWMNISEFDHRLMKNLSMLANDPLETYPSVNKVWERFNMYFTQVIQLLFNAPIFRDYLRQALEEFKADNVQYVEIRGQLSGFSELDGTVHDAAYGLNLYKEVIEKFMADNPDFGGAKVIMSGLRFKPTAAIRDEVITAMTLREQYPDFLLGYDLVGQEDSNNPLLTYIDELLYPSTQNKHLPYFFHAAETKWQGTETDYNLVDALLLNTTRIGHGYGLAKHALLSEMVKQKDIAVEVNPISNQVLGLVDDLRNHQLISLLADDFPVVFSSDDPATWEALPMSHDIYLAFMEMSGEDQGLAFLKEAFQKSLKYSVLTPTERTRITNLWNQKWDQFVIDALNSR